MITRRDLLGSMLALTGEMSLRGRLDALSPADTTPEAASRDDLTQFVKIAIGTGGHGHTYPGATVPSVWCSSRRTRSTMGGTGVRDTTAPTAPSWALVT